MPKTVKLQLDTTKAMQYRQVVMQSVFNLHRMA